MFSFRFFFRSGAIALLLSGLLPSEALTLSPPTPLLTQAEATPAQMQQQFRAGLAKYREGTGAAWRDAIALWEVTRQFWHQTGNIEQEALVLGWLGRVRTQLGDLDAAKANYERLLAIAQQQDDDFTQAQTLSALAELAQIRGDYEVALSTEEAALALWQTQDYRSGEAQSLNHLGLLANLLGDTDQAIAYLEQALAISRAVENGEGAAATLNNLGQVYDRQGDPAAAIAHYQAALQQWQKLGNERNQAAALNNLGYAQLTRDPAQAQAHLQQALTLWRKVGDRRGEASSLSNLGVLYAQTADFASAEAAQKTALDIRQATGDRLKAALSYYRLALIYREQGQRDRALREIRQAIQIVETLRTTIERQELRTSFFATQQDYYELYIDLLMAAAAAEPEQAQTFWAEALVASEQAKARSLLDVLAAASADIRQGVAPQLLARERQIQAQLDAAERRRIALLTPGSGGLELNGRREANELAAAIGAEISQLLVAYEAVQSQIRLSSPHYAEITQPRPLSLREIQTELLDAETVLVSYFLGRDRSYVWVVSTDAIAGYVLPDRDTVTEATRTAYRRLQQNLSPERLRGPMGAVSQLILEPIQAHLGQKRLLVVPDGSLNYLPFAALQAPEHLQNPDYQPLLAAHEIITLPSASTLGILRREYRARSRAPETLAVIADPVFGLDDERVRGAATSEFFNLPESLRRAATESNILLTRLPFTQTEANAITALVPAGDAIAALGLAANREFVLSDTLADYRMVHFATHGFLNSQTPELSGLALSLVDRGGQPQNGFLRFHEVFNLTLNAELVVLSACQTGLGPTVRGEGTISLTRGFMYAGAERVAVSLWSVDDQGTAVLMTEFYAQMLNADMAPAAALRAAQLELFKSEEWRSPYYWAAFTLQGEWQ